MKGLYLVTLFSAITLAVIADELADEYQIPTSCPPIDPFDRTIHLAHEYDCTKFYKCSFGEKILQSCPWMNQAHTRRLHFNAREQVCDWPALAGCGSSPFPDPNPNPNPYPYCPINTNGRVIRRHHQTYCDYFYLCIDGVEETVKCPSGYLYNRILQVCDLAANVDCGGSIPEPNPGPNPGPNPRPNPRPTNKCPAKGSNTKVLLPHECRCTSYYECLDGNMVRKECPNGYEYDYQRQVCGPKYVVNCVRPIPGYGDSDSETATLIPAVPTNKCSDDDEGKKLPHETSSTSYYLCSDGKKVLKECIGGLYFNDILQICDYPDV